MEIKDEKTVELSEVKRDFTSASKIADEDGSVLVYEGGRPLYRITALSHGEQVDIVANKIFNKYDEAFKELAK